MARNYGAKGGKFERDFCRQLSLWWTNQVRDDLFWRTAGSGGRATTRAKSGKQSAGHAGDITSTDPSSQPLTDLISFELKRGYNSCTIHDIMDKPRSVVLGFVEQAKESSHIGGTFSWAVVHKRDAGAALIYVPDDLYRGLCDHGANVIRRAASVDISDCILIVARLDDFLEAVTPGCVKALARVS